MEKIIEIRKNEHAQKAYEEKDMKARFDPFGHYGSLVLIGESGKYYFLNSLGILTEDGEKMELPDEIEFTFTGETECCCSYKNGACQVNQMEKISIFCPDSKGEKIVGTACRHKGFRNIFCGFYPIWSEKQWNEVMALE